jgi:hypothetical protein
MKKSLLLIAVAFISFASLSAQEVRFGIKGGVNLASISGDDYGLASLDSRTGFHIGGLVEIPLVGKFSVQPEILYSSQGSKYNFFAQDGDIKLDYVTVPIMAKYNIIAGLSAELGPVIGVLVKAEEDDGDTSEDVKELFKSTDVGIGIGASYRLPMGVFFGLRYNKGISDINDDPDNSGKNQNNVFQVSAGYSF